MRYARVTIDAIGYELAPVVVTSAELEERLAPCYAALRLVPGQLEALTGIAERRWWPEGYRVSDGAIAAGRKALALAGIPAGAVEACLYAGVCREQFEPATACAVAAALGVHPGAAVHDLSNACLGVLNGMIDIANRIELGQIRAGLVTACESARPINDIMIDRMCRAPAMERFTTALATLTGGSGAAAVVLSDGSFGGARPRRLRTGVTQTAPEHHALCCWGHEPVVPGAPGTVREVMHTDAVAVLTHGVALGRRTWAAHLAELGVDADAVDRVICHQVGSAHQDMILETLGIPRERDFTTFRMLGNIGTVSLPLTAALAEERGVLQPGHRVSWLGIGSGLNCMMLGCEW